MSYNLIALFDFLALVQGILLGIFLILFSNKQRPSLFLGLFLIIYSLDLLSSILDDLNIIDEHPEFLFLPLSFYYLSAPLFYFYCKQIMGRYSFKKDFIYLVPGILEVLFLGILFSQPTNKKIEIISSSIFWNNILFLLELTGIIYSSVMMVLTLRLISKNRERVVNFYSYTIGKTLNWLKWTASVLLIFSVLILLFGFFDDSIASQVSYAIISGINVIIIFWIGLSGFKQQIIFKSLDTTYPSYFKKELPNTQNQDLKIDEEDYKRLINYIENSQCYTNPKLQLAELSERANISVRRLSMLINQKAGLNFNQLINKYRITKAKEMLSDRKYDHYNMLGIAYEVGFNSKTSFYTSFKEFSQMTPQQFKKQSQAVFN